MFNLLSASICSLQQRMRDCCKSQDMRDSFDVLCGQAWCQVLATTEKLLRHLQQTHSDASERCLPLMSQRCSLHMKQTICSSTPQCRTSCLWASRP